MLSSLVASGCDNVNFVDIGATKFCNNHMFYRHYGRQIWHQREFRVSVLIFKPHEQRSLEQYILLNMLYTGNVSTGTKGNWEQQYQPFRC